MTKGLTKREVNLLYFAFIFLLLFVGLYLGIFPLLRQNSDLNFDISEAEHRELEMRLAIENLKTIEQSIIQTNGEISKSKAVFNETLFNEDIDRYFTLLVEECGFVPYKLVIDNFSAKDASGITYADASFELAGTTQNLTRLIDKAYNIPYAVISKFNYIESSGGYNVTMRIYMI